MKKAIEKAADIFLKKTKDKSIKVISHNDTDGITSAAILTKTLRKLDKKFSVKIVKNLEKDYLKKLKNNIIIFLDLGSGLLKEISEMDSNIFIIDHHEIKGKPGENTVFINPHSFDEEEISASGLTYMFSKALYSKDEQLANLAIIGMVGDMLGKEISKLNNKILNEANAEVRKGLLIYPATRPINKALEFSSSLYVPGVTGNSKGAYKLVLEAGIEKENGRFKSLIELTEEEQSKLLTSILLRTKKQDQDLIGNIHLVKFFNKLEDARELSAMINACSRLGHSHTAISLCLHNERAKKRAEEIYANYKQHLVKALNYAETKKQEKESHIILNAKNKIKDTIIGTVASILSMSKEYEQGTIIIALAYSKDKVKVSARIAGRGQGNVRKILEEATENIEGEAGGHPQAAGCLIPKEKEQEFLENIEKALQTKVVKV